MASELVDAAANAEAWRAKIGNPVFLAGIAIVAATFGWSYWPIACELVRIWNHEPDYSHGYFVVPAALYFLWFRRGSLPAPSDRLQWGGMVLLVLSGAIRFAGSLWYIDALQAWSIPFWVAGTCWLFGGWRLLWWSLPSVGFLAFMIPLPFRAEHLLSFPLQRVATKLSCWLLQSLGRPAVAEGNVIYLNDITLGVAEACSGLRIFMSIAALAYIYMVLAKRDWWMKAILCASVLPVALLTNAVRIVATALLHEWVSGEAAHKFSHDLAGWLMAPLAAGLLGLVSWYLGRLLVDVEIVSPGELMFGVHGDGKSKR
ncbi:MAG TPA: exosortase/archaeosortase family protein [Pirellulales bacterium]|nr:exosortase/archaeosortase family protein [Pirellulales bacterium]